MIYRLSTSKNRKNVYATNVFDDIADLERRILRWTVYLQYRLSKINVYIQNSTQKNWGLNQTVLYSNVFELKKKIHSAA